MQQSPRMLKISAGNEEFGLCGKWLLHGFNIAKLNLQGNPNLCRGLRERAGRKYVHAFALRYPPSATNPAFSIDEIAQASSLSELSPVMPTAPKMTPSCLIRTPPATGTSEPSDKAFIA